MYFRNFLLVPLFVVTGGFYFCQTPVELELYKINPPKRVPDYDVSGRVPGACLVCSKKALSEFKHSGFNSGCDKTANISEGRSAMVICPEVMEIINRDEERKTDAERRLKEAQLSFSSKGYKNRNLMKKDIESKKAFKVYNKLKNELIAAEEELVSATFAYNRTTQFIEDFKKNDPDEYNRMNNLTYKDSWGEMYKLSIYITSVVEPKLGNTHFVYNKLSGTISFKEEDSTYDHAVKVTLDICTAKRDILAHEFGHVADLASNPAAYVRNKEAYGELDCQNPKNRNRPIVKPAVDMQERYLKILEGVK